ncbi:hypothetical protein QYF61_024638 [Mycteria americana]|uniref:Uncharacterized protein n=1 Tax=Mycteria americana TaxID=33587 RepID=A0AAN7NPQ6_MYCAM|nr:hypothetical protein QYF61_024638 [Mycteria americana]
MSREGILHLYSAPVKPHLEFCIQLWSSQHSKGINLFEQGWNTSPYEERLRELGLLSLEKRRLWEDIIVAFQYLKGLIRKTETDFLPGDSSDRTRGNGFKLKEGRFRLDIEVSIWDIRKKYFTMRVVRHWNRLPREVVDAPSLEVFTARLDGALGNLL